MRLVNLEELADQIFFYFRHVSAVVGVCVRWRSA
jgi:hypothetical protein